MLPLALELVLEREQPRLRRLTPCVTTYSGFLTNQRNSNLEDVTSQQVFDIISIAYILNENAQRYRRVMVMSVSKSHADEGPSIVQPNQGQESPQSTGARSPSPCFLSEDSSNYGDDSSDYDDDDDHRPNPQSLLQSDLHRQNPSNRGYQIWNRYRRDNPGACGFARTLVPQKPFPFFRLPSEIRKQIITPILQSTQELQQMPGDQSTHDDWLFPVDVRIFAVSQQMNMEATQIFYSSNVFRVETTEADQLPLWIREAASPMSPLQHMRRIHVLARYLGDDVLSYLDRNFTPIAQALRHCQSLVSLRISMCIWSTVAPGFRQGVDDILWRSLSNLRGLEDLTFGEKIKLDGKEETFPPIGSEEVHQRLRNVMTTSGSAPE